MITTTLKAIRQHRPCGLEIGSNEGYDLLRKNLGKDYGDASPIRFSQIVESNGVADAIWCLRSICPEHSKEVRLFAADCAERVLPIYEEKYPKDKRPRKAVQAARAFAEGRVTEEELRAAHAAANGAAAWVPAAADAAAAEAAAWAAYAHAAAYYAHAACVAAADAAYAADAEREAQGRLLLERFG